MSLSIFQLIYIQILFNYFLYRYNELVHDIKIIDKKGYTFFERKDNNNYFYSKIDSLNVGKLETEFSIVFDKESKQYSITQAYYDNNKLIDRVETKKQSEFALIFQPDQMKSPNSNIINEKNIVLSYKPLH